MRIKPGFTLRQVCGEHIIVDNGDASIDMSLLMALNESATYLWNKVAGREFDEQQLADMLTEEYDVDRCTAQADARHLAHRWLELGVAEQ